MITAFLLVTAEREYLAKIGPALAACPGVLETYTTTGEVDFIVKAAVGDLEELASLIQDHVSAIDGISATSTHLAMRRYSADEVAAAFDLGID